MASAIVNQWRKEFITVLQQRENAMPLKEAALQERLGAWTKALTSVVTATCDAMGWHASAKGHSLEVLPVSREEYLSLDVIAFEKPEKGWRFPVAVMELENSQNDDLIAYALWKTLCIRTQLRVLFCYRPSTNQAPTLVRFLRDQVISGLSLEERARQEGETLVVVGNREESAIFPYGFFKWWQLETNTGTFRLI
ncbi:MAG: hypothetical protein M1132_01525 [Chloroflexi bacterium]|nr:hypothetical protein [Chloroflexota bacterium]